MVISLQRNSNEFLKVGEAADKQIVCYVIRIVPIHKTCLERRDESNQRQQQSNSKQPIRVIRCLINLFRNRWLMFGLLCLNIFFHKKQLTDQKQYLFSAISFSAIFLRASFTFSGSTLVKRFKPISIIRCSSPSANELIASPPAL